jgi:hypothetical protein
VRFIAGRISFPPTPSAHGPCRLDLSILEEQ